MSDRLPTRLLVGALLRQVNDAGGFAVVRARGDAQAGAVLVLLADGRAIERGVGADGRPALIAAHGGGGDADGDAYWRRRRARDPDLWVIELDFARAEALAAEVLLGG